MPCQNDGKRIVIDASVAQASGGEDAIHPTSINCRVLLQTVRRECYQVFMSDQISDEWNIHQSQFARKWRTEMLRSGQLKIHNLEENTVLRNKIVNRFTEEQTEIMIKDCLLLEAALASDKTIISLDDEVCALFAAACSYIGEIKEVIWINPNDGTIIIWLENGAILDIRRQLLSYAEISNPCLQGGNPIIAGTKFRVHDIVKNYQRNHYSIDDTLMHYPDLTRQQIQAAIDYDSNHIDAIN